MQEHHVVSEERQSLWLLTTSPAIWAGHFAVSYALAALWCGTDPDRAASGVAPPTLGILISGFVALAAIVYTGVAGWRKHSLGDETPPHDRDTPEDRSRFLGFATVLLSGLSALATIFVMLSAALVPLCG
jgi:hypothetical protein